MARAKFVKKANKSPGKCHKCAREITPGMAYYWTKSFRGPRKIRCDNLKCRFRDSDLTGSDKLSRLYSAREAVEDFLLTDFMTADEVKDTLTQAAEEAREVGSEYQQAADAFAGRREEWEEKAGQCESWADELEGLDIEECDLADQEDKDKEEDTALEDWREEVRQEIDSALSSLEL